MREILFRGKRIDNKEWVEGFLIKVKRITYIFSLEHIRFMCVSHAGNADVHLTEVITATAGQYTGLTDKNDKKIFEGDIISTTKYGIDDGNGRNFSGKDKFLVGYADGTYHLENKLRKFCLRPDITCEVIGNIFDNPELLEE